MNHTEKIRILTERFFEGDTTLSEEQELYAYYRQAPACLPADLRPYREMFVDLAILPYTEPRVHEPSRKVSLWPRWAAAAAVAVLAVGGTLLLFHRSPSSAPAEEGDYVSYIYGRRTTDRSVVMDEMKKTRIAMAYEGCDVVEEQLKAMFDNE